MVGESGSHLVQEYHLVAVLPHFNLIVFYAWKQIGKLVELMVMRGKERLCADMIMQVFRQCPCDADPVKCARAASHFIEENQAAGRCRVHNVCRFVHFYQKRTLTRR